MSLFAGAPDGAVGTGAGFPIDGRGTRTILLRRGRLISSNPQGGLMKAGKIPGLLVLVSVALPAVPVASDAQEAVLTGTVTDSTGGVLPGVTVTAVHEATGNRFVA